jgi:hypothetical protein
MHTSRRRLKVLCHLPSLSRPQVSKEKKGVVVDARCRDLTSAAVVQKGRDNPGSVDLCDWHEVRIEPCVIFPEADLLKNLGKMEPGKLVPGGIWTLADVMEYGHKHGTCPYFTVRRMVSFVLRDILTVANSPRAAVCRRGYIFLSLPT